MSRSLIFGAGYQITSFILLLVQAIVLPRFLGLEVYGVGLLMLVPVLIIGGLWEPIVQRFCITGNGLPQGALLIGLPILLVLYVAYLRVVLSAQDQMWLAILVGVLFLVEYVCATFYLTVLQAGRSFLVIFILSGIGLLLSVSSFLSGAVYFLVPLFYCLYFLPVFVYGLFAVHKKFAFTPWSKGAFDEVLNAISTRIFYIGVNNFYVVVIGVYAGVAKAAIFRVVISLCSAFRFINPVSVGQFYSMLTGRSGWSLLAFALLPLVFFYFGIMLAWVGQFWLIKYGLLFLGEGGAGVLDFFFGVMWFVPLYLWTPYLTLLYASVLGWRENVLICCAAISSGSVFLYWDNVELFFGGASALYCALTLVVGVAKSKSRFS